jgi:hypothetical protein
LKTKGRFVPESNYHPIAKPAVEIQIIGLNRDLTRETKKADARYEVYFDLSGIPSQAWTKILSREWKRLNPTEPRLWDRIAISNQYLVMYWPPQEIAQKHLPNLKLAVAATNKTHRKSVDKQAGMAQKIKR